MKQIVIPVGKENPEDDYLSLLEIFKARFPGLIKVSDALVIESEVPQVMALLSAMAVQGKPVTGENGNQRTCVDCGVEISNKSERCNKCAAVKRRGKKRSYEGAPNGTEKHVYE